MKKALPIGISDYKELIEGNYYYIDKTLLIKEILIARPKALLLPRPRRFGKTLNLSMLHYFFEQTDENTAMLFDDTAIAQHPECMKEQKQYPVMFLSFKGVKDATWKNAYITISEIIAKEFERHNYLLLNNLSTYDRTIFNDILERKADHNALSKSLFLLSELLHNHYKKRVIILIDEYDAPITTGYNEHYYKSVADFMRSLLGNACKDNNYLHLAVLTGILRIAKESIFSGLNNLSVQTILDEAYQDSFGFTESEVQRLFEDQELSCSFNAVKEWYNGYLFGNATIYNPWSVLQCAAHKGKLAPYWVNTSDNALIEKLLVQSDQKVKKELERLLTNEPVETGINEATVFIGIEHDEQAVWSLLAFSGYLSVAETKQIGNRAIYTLKIPNNEIKLVYEDLITKIFKEVLKPAKSDELLRALTAGDSETFGYLLQEFVENSISMFDFTKEPENSYHLFVLGILVYLSDRYAVKSNRESGYGRYDIMIIPRDPKQPGIIIEFKKVLEKETLEEAAQRAIEQIQQKNYACEMRDRGITKIVQLGIAYRGKEIFVQAVEVC